MTTVSPSSNAELLSPEEQDRLDAALRLRYFSEDWVTEPRRADSGADLSPKAKVTYDENKFQVEFNVQDYSPEELSIKTEGDTLIVMAKHETKTESGGSFVSKQFEQRFSLPSGVKPECISSSLSKSGVLTVTAPR